MSYFRHLILRTSKNLTIHLKKHFSTQICPQLTFFTHLWRNIYHQIVPLHIINMNFAMKQKDILSALKAHYGIEELNDMQKAVLNATGNDGDIILLSPTGSGKTIAFLTPLLKALKEPNGRVQAVIIAPSRELVMQIGKVARDMATGYKVTCCYGGHNVLDEKQSLSVTPSIIVSTPGRLLDHINREHIDLHSTRLLVLDEFDKSLELGFQDEMRRILRRMPNISRRFLTSATHIEEIPDFVRIFKPQTIDFGEKKEELDTRTTVLRVNSDDKDKLQALLKLLKNVPCGRTIVFANYRDAVERIYTFLKDNNVPVGVYHGGLDQIDREKAISMFNNGSYMVMITTDLGARGLDIAEVTNIIHYHIPSSEETYTHRNGRTARMHATGNVYVLVNTADNLPEYMKFDDNFEMKDDAEMQLSAPFATLFFQAGKKEKISRGDIVGFIGNNGGIEGKEIGTIDLRDHYALVAVPADKANEILNRIKSLKIKNKRVRITLTEI